MLRLRCLLPLVMALLLCMVGESVAQQGGFGKGNPPPNQMPKGQAEAAAGMAIGFLVCIGVSVVAGIALKIFIILFIVKDAKKRGMDPTMWVILEIFVGLVGLIVYLCVREPLLSERRRRQYDDDEDDGHDDLIRRRR